MMSEIIWDNSIVLPYRLAQLHHGLPYLIVDIFSNVLHKDRLIWNLNESGQLSVYVAYLVSIHPTLQILAI